MKHLTTLLVFLALSMSLPAQSGTTPPPCSAEEYQRFDFWIGDWEVWANDSVVGYNKVEQVLGECVIMENWEGKGASRGKSFNLYNRQTEEWEQTWVDNFGTVIHFHGSFNKRGTTLSMNAEGKAQNGGDVLYKLTFQKNDDGSVRQLWEASRTNGKNWVTLFDGLYKKRA